MAKKKKVLKPKIVKPKKEKLDALSSKSPKGKANTKLEEIPKQAPQYQMRPLQLPQPLIWWRSIKW